MFNFTVINTNYQGMPIMLITLIFHLPFKTKFVNSILSCYGNVVEMTESHTEFTFSVVARGSEERERERERE